MGTTVLLIALLVAGRSGASLACELWCNTPTAETPHGAVGCHRTPDTDVEGEQVVAAAACHDVPAVTAFVNPSRQPGTRSALMFSAVHDLPAVLVHRDPAGEGWPVSNGQPPRPPAFRTVLRI